MVRPSRFLRALVVAAGSAALGLGLAVAPAVAAPSEPDPTPAARPGLEPGAKQLPAGSSALKARRTSKAAKAARDATVQRDTAPLRVTMAGLSPSYVPERRNLVVRGEVTNRTDETWTTVKLYAFIGSEPMRTTGALAAAMDEPYESDVGHRIVNEGETGTVIDELGPGQTRSYVVRVPAAALRARVPEGGVYWFGVHALGESSTSSLDDATADGRARTFLPYVPPRVTTPVKTALVMPLVRSLPRRSDGSIDFDDQAVRALSSGGRLRELLDFVGAAGSAPVTWVVDPALIDSIGDLAAGNPPRSLTPTIPPDDGTEAPDDDPTEEPDDGAEGSPDDETVPTTASSRAATSWLEALPAALAGNEVLTLPYGNVDVPGALAHDVDLLEIARAKHSEILDGLDVSTAPVLAAPAGYLDADSIRSADKDTQILVSDRMFDTATPAVAELEGHQLSVASSAAATGSPGPGTGVTAVGLRQRILAEAAVRALRADQPPLTVVLPTDWELESADDFFAGLDVDWLDLRTLSGLRTGVTAQPVTEDQVVYPPSQRRRELDALTFDAADNLVAAGDTLQNVLGENFSIAGEVTQEALSGVSYAARADPVAARAMLDRSRGWIDDKLAQVTITAADGITLSGASGSFLVTVSNDLDEAVTVGVTALPEDEITVTAPDPVLLPPGTRANVLLQVRTTSNRVHNVTLMVTDSKGAPLGASDQLPIRSAQVSAVIWVIMGSGVGLLFLAIAIRLFRRMRSARRGGPVEST